MLASDIMSFYKEQLEEDTGNYIYDRAMASKKTMQETIHELIDEVAASVESVRKILGEGKARDAFESFARGYLAFHTCSPRYRLMEIIDCKYMAD